MRGPSALPSVSADSSGNRGPLAMPMRGEVSMRSLSKSGKRNAEAGWGTIYALSESPDFLAVAGFSAVGLLISLYLAMHFAFTDAMTTLLTQFAQFL
jgi:hypothetical protein